MPRSLMMANPGATMPDLCQCGSLKARQSNVACDACFAAIPKDVRDHFLEKSRNKRGFPSYFDALKKVQRALAEVRKASGVPS